MTTDPNPYNITLDNGTWVTMSEIRQRIRKYTSRTARKWMTSQEYTKVLDRIMSPEWLRPRYGYTVSALCRDADNEFINCIFGE